MSSSRLLEACVTEIKKNGWAIAVERSDQAEARPASAAYTVGLFEQFGHPELLVFGLTVSTMQAMLTGMAEAIKRTGARFKAGESYAQVLEKHEILLRAIPAHEAEKRMRVAPTYYGRRHFEALQIVWPDETGRYPWDPGFAREYRRRQPLLSLNS